MVDLSDTSKLKCVYSAQADYATPEHCHDEHAMLLLPLVGSMTVQDDASGGKRILESSFFYFAEAGTPHETKSNRSVQEHLAIYLNADWKRFVIEQAAHSGSPWHRAGIWRLSENATDLGRILIRMTRSGVGDTRQLHQVGALFAEDCFDLILSSPPAFSAHPFDYGASVVMDGLDWLRGHLSDAVSPYDLAQALGVSQRHLTRLFREKTGRTIMETMREERMIEAERLLRETDWSVQQVATMCGLENAAYFSTCFKTRFGASPTAYRKSLIG